MEELKTNILCKAKSNNWIIGYYVELDNSPYIIPTNTSIKNLTTNIVPVNKDTICRFTGMYDCHNVPIFVNDLIVAGQHKCRTITNDPPTHEEYCEYAGILKVTDNSYYFGLEEYEDLRDCFIDGCTDDISNLKEEYFIENLGNYEDSIEKAYAFWNDPNTKKVFN